jgi:hypothetical protein
LAVTEKTKRVISGLTGVIQLTKANAQVLDQAQLNAGANQRLTATPPAVKAPAVKAPAVKAPAAKPKRN